MKKRLTVQGVKAIKPPAKGRRDYQDAVVPGLVLRVSSTGRKTYSVSYWLDGARPRKTLGFSEDSPLPGAGSKFKRMSLADARDAAKAVLQAVHIGLDPAAEHREKKDAATFKRIARDYVERHAKKKKSAKGAREDELRIENVLIPRWGARKAGDVLRRDVVALLDEYEDEGKMYARNRMAALISKLYNFAIKRDVAGLDGNPAHGLVDAQLEKPRKRVLSDDELKAVLPLFGDQGLAGLGFRLMLLTAQRPGEVFGMEWAEIDGDLWSIPKARTKNRRSKFAPDFHVVPLSRQARAVVNELRGFDGSRYVFPSPTRNDMAFTNYGKQARAIIAAAELEDDWRIYDLRTAAMTGMGEMGVEPHVLSAIANHVSTGVTQRHYALNSYLEEKRAALSKWGAHVEKLAPKKIADVIPVGAVART